MRDRVTTVLEVCGLILIACGVAAVNAPAGLVATGAICVFVGYLEGRK